MNCTGEDYTKRYTAAVVFCVLLALVVIFQLVIIIVLAARLKGTKVEVVLRHYTIALWNWTVTHVRHLVNRVRGREPQANQINNDNELTAIQLQSSEQLEGHTNVMATSLSPQNSIQNMAKVMMSTQPKSISTTPSSYPQHQTQSIPMVPKRQDVVSRPPIKLTQQLNQKFAERANINKPPVQDHLPIEKTKEEPANIVFSYYDTAGDTSQFEIAQNYEVPVESNYNNCAKERPEEVVIAAYDFATVPEIPATKPKRPRASQSGTDGQSVDHYETPNVVGLQYPDPNAYYEIPHHPT